ncbi:MAG: Manganese transport system rane protein MntB [Planctomycetota bacterium]|jgi:manganese/zinc/iron transport system permease protein
MTSMESWLRLVTLQDANTRVVLLGTMVLGVACGVVGVLAGLRGRALAGDAVAHAALPGVCVAYLVFGDGHFGTLLLGALAVGLLAAAGIGAARAVPRLKEDSVTAIAIGGFFGAGLTLSRLAQDRPGGHRAGLDGFIFGKAASMVASDAWTILAVAAMVVCVVALLRKEFTLLCFDQSFAAGLGWPIRWLDQLLMLLVCLCVVAGLPAVGVVLVVALLVIPAAAARFWTHRIRTMLAVAALLGALSALLGTAVSATLPAPAGTGARGWPTGPLVVLVAAALFVVSLLAAPDRGLVVRAVRAWGMRRRVALQHLLRDVYERLEAAGDPGGVWSPRSLSRNRVDAVALTRARAAGLVRRDGEGWRLTDRGQAEARRVVRAHRLWELWLIEHADIAPDHVDRDADELEHVLPPSVLAALETRLRQGPATMPASPHPITLDGHGPGEAP